MALTETLYKHVILNEEGVPLISGTTMKVSELVLEYLTDQSSPEALLQQHPYLSMGQIHSTLAYYWDNKKQIDERIQKDLEEVEVLRKMFLASTLASRLKDHKLQKQN